MFVKEAKHYVFTPVVSDAEKLVFQEGQHYFRLRLAEMFLKDDRKLFRKAVPVVSSIVSLQFGVETALYRDDYRYFSEYNSRSMPPLPILF